MPIQNAAIVSNGIVTKMIVVDTVGNFNYSAAGYILAGDGIGIGWIQQSDGFSPPTSGLIPITTTPSGSISVSTSYAASLAAYMAANRA